MSIQSWKWRNIDSIFRFIIFSGNYSSRSSQNALQWVNCRDWTRFPDPLWRHPSYGQVQPGSRRDLAVRRVVLPGWVKSVVRAIPSSTETPERPPEIHERLPNLAESNARSSCDGESDSRWQRRFSPGQFSPTLHYKSPNIVYRDNCQNWRSALDSIFLILDRDRSNYVTTVFQKKVSAAKSNGHNRAILVRTTFYHFPRRHGLFLYKRIGNTM
jgi:hypothetical protein